MGLSDFISLLIMLVLAVTAGAIFWYSWETREMRKVMVKQTEEIIKQTELSMTPLITAYFDKIDCACYIKNVGYGPAMNINIADINILVDEVDYELDGLELQFVFEMIYALMPQEKQKIDNYEVESLNYPGEICKLDRSDREAALERYLKVGSLELIITYENLIGRKFSSKAECGKYGNILLETKKLTN